jgi:AcrR family transcriptional regulator
MVVAMPVERIEPGSRPPRRRNPRGEGGRLRDDLIEAASDLMAEHGTAEAATLRAVARRAGVSAPSVYRHFEDREALVQAVVAQRFHDLTDAIEAAGAAAGPDAGPPDRLRAGCLGYIRYGLDNPGHYRVLFDTPTGPFSEDTAEAANAAFGSLVDAIAACQEAGEAPAGDAFALAASVWPAMHGGVMLRIVATQFPWPPVEEHLERVLTGIVGLRPAAQ